MNLEIKTGYIYNLESKIMKNGKRYLRFTLGTRRNYKEDGEYRLNYRLCESFIENNSRFIEHQWNKNPKAIFYIEGEGYDNSWQDKNGAWHYRSVTRVTRAELIGLRAYDNGKKEDEPDIAAEIDW